MSTQDNNSHSSKKEINTLEDFRKVAEGFVLSEFFKSKAYFGIFNFSIIFLTGFAGGIYSGYLYFSKFIENLKEDKTLTLEKLSEARFEICKKTSEYNIKLSILKEKDSIISRLENKIVDMSKEHGIVLAENVKLKTTSPEDLIFIQLFSFNSTGIPVNTSYALSPRFLLKIDDKRSLTILDRKQGKVFKKDFVKDEVYELKFLDLKVSASFRFKENIDDKAARSAIYHSVDLCFFTFLRP